MMGPPRRRRRGSQSWQVAGLRRRDLVVEDGHREQHDGRVLGHRDELERDRRGQLHREYRQQVDQEAESGLQEGRGPSEVDGHLSRAQQRARCSVCALYGMPDVV